MSQWLSLGCASQINAVIALIILPGITSIASGTAICQPQIKALQAFCPREMGNRWYFPDLPAFKLLWAAEIDQFPDYTSNFSVVNSTNYWYSMMTDEEFQFQEFPLMGYNVTTSNYLASKAGAQIGGSFGILLLDSILLRLIVLGFIQLLITSCWDCCCGKCCAKSANRLGMTPYNMPQAEAVRLTFSSSKMPSAKGGPSELGTWLAQDERGP